MSKPLAADSAVTTEALLDRALTALGGEEALLKLAGVTYHSPK